MPPRAAPLIQNVLSRSVRSLAGAWRAIVDPYENGYYDYRREPLATDGYFADRKPASSADLVEYDFDGSEPLEVPGDWNSQRRELLLYEGTVWYRTRFDGGPAAPARRRFLRFGAANYEARVWVNGAPAGVHRGGFTPFDVEVTSLLVPGPNSLVVKVDSARRREGVPTLNTDWWNYGGLTRDVLLVDVPQTFLRDYALQLDPREPGRLTGFVQLDGPARRQAVKVRLPEAGLEVTVRTDDDGFAPVELRGTVERWWPERPRLHAVELEAETDRVTDRIGFRTIEARGADLLLNGEPVFLRGISIHEQAPHREGRSHGEADARTLLGWARELGANFVRLAHYPHDEHTVRLADAMGLLVWAEIPVYWTIDWENPDTLENARAQLTELVTRDRNRASVVLWSVGNETPRTEPRLRFLRELVRTARALDPTRLVSAALEQRQIAPLLQRIDDPLGAELDVLGCNEYLGWYIGLPDRPDGVRWETPHDKPLVVTEFGAEAKAGHHGDAGARWTEEYQAEVYRHQLRMLDEIPFLRGLSPWILMDFRSPRRPLPGIQDGWNRKGLVSEQGVRKQAFFVLQAHYRELARRWARSPA